MTGLTVSLIIIGVRILTAPLILIWPIGGVIINMIADSLDHPIAQHFGWGLLGDNHYQYWDKLLDTWYLFFIFLVTRRWKNIRARQTAKVLFFWRFAGFVLLELAGWERVLVFTPNIFEYFYLFWAIVIRWFPRFTLTTRRLIIALTTIGIFKIADEIRIHWIHVHFDIIKTYVLPYIIR